MRKLSIITCLTALVLVFTLTGVCSAEQSNDSTAGSSMTLVTDMLDREINVPSEIDGVLSTAPHVTTIVYMIAPEKLLGWNWIPDGDLISPEYKDLPVVNGWYGKCSGNYETFMSMNPDLILEGYNAAGDPMNSIEERQENFGDIPVVGVENTIDALEYEKPITFVGSVIGAEEKATELNEFYHRVLDMVQDDTGSLTDEEKKTVYYANGPTGLATSPSGSQHSQLIDIANGVNIAECPIKTVVGNTEVSIEQILEWNPEVIICEDAQFYDTIFEDEMWQDIRAVQTGDVYLTPRSPFCWFDFPPSTNTIIGIPWTASVIYPEQCADIDMEELTREFYSKFYHYDLTDEELKQLLNP